MAGRRADRAFEQGLGRLVADSPDVVACFDRELRHLYVNRAAESVAGRPAAAFVGKTHRELGFAPDLCDLWEDAIRRVFGTGERAELSLDVVDSAGSTRSFDVGLVAQLDDEGSIDFVVSYAREVTAARKLAMEQAARAHADLYVRLFEEARDAVLICDDDRRYVAANPAAADLVGLPAPQLIGRRIDDLAGPGMDVDAAWRSFRETGELAGDFTLRRADGEMRTVDFRARASFAPGLHLSILRDVSERKQLDRALDLERRRFAETMRQMPSGVVIAEAPSGRLVYANARAEELWGHPMPATESVADYRQFVATRPDGRPIAPEAFPTARALRGEVIVREKVLLDVKGRPRVLVVNSVPIRDDAAVIVGAITVFDDITDEERANEERVRLLSTLELFIAILGHDLRNPLAAIALGAHALRQGGEVTERGRKVVDRVATAVDRATRLVDQLLDVTRIRSGAGLPMEPRRTDLAAIVRRAIEEMPTMEPPSPLVVEIRGDTSGTWDEDRLAQLVGNLLANAVTHGVCGAPVTVVVNGQRDTIELLVHNLGPAIPEAARLTLFEPFRRREGSLGLGLGLYICAQIAHAHGGQLTVCSSEPEGTTFRLELPSRGRPPTPPAS